MKKEAIMLLILFNSMLAICFGKFSIFVCGTLYICILFEATEKLLGADKTIYKRLVIIWLIQVGIMLIIYFVLKMTYGLPYDMNGLDDYMADGEWTDYCIENKIYSINAMKNSSKNFYILANNKAHLILIVWMKLFCSLFGGYHTLNIRMFNLMVWVLIAIIMGKYAFEYLGADIKTTKRIVTVIALFPNAIFISSLVYRDTLVSFLIVVIFYLWTCFRGKKLKAKIGIILLTTVIFYCTYYLRVQALLYVGAAIAIGIANINPEKKLITGHIDKTKGFLLGIMILLMFIGGRAVLANFYKYFSGYSIMNSESNGIQAFINRIPLFPFGWIMRTLFYLLLPFYYRDIIPIDIFNNPVSSIRTFVSWGTILLFFLYPYVFSYWKKMNNIVILYLFMLISIAVTTSGFRHVILTYPMLLTMGIVKLKQTSFRIKQENAVACTCMAGFFILTIVMVKIVL